MTAAAEAAERGETLNDFLDHAALVSDSDNLDERAQVLCSPCHNNQYPVCSSPVWRRACSRTSGHWSPSRMEEDGGSATSG